MSATPEEVTVLVPDGLGELALAEIQSATGRKAVSLPAPRSEIESFLDHLSGSLDTDDLWLQRRHISALGRLVDHAVNVGQIDAVRPLVDRASS